MKRILQRLLVVVGTSAGLLTVVETVTNAQTPTNHCEPVVHDTP